MQPGRAPTLLVTIPFVWKVISAMWTSLSSWNWKRPQGSPDLWECGRMKGGRHLVAGVFSRAGTRKLRVLVTCHHRVLQSACDKIVGSENSLFPYKPLPVGSLNREEQVGRGELQPERGNNGQVSLFRLTSRRGRKIC